MQTGIITQGGAWFRHPDFPKGQLQGKDAVRDFLAANPDMIEKLRQDMVLAAYNTTGNIMEETSNGVAHDAFDVVADPVVNEVPNE